MGVRVSGVVSFMYISMNCDGNSTIMDLILIAP